VGLSTNRTRTCGLQLLFDGVWRGLIINRSKSHFVQTSVRRGYSFGGQAELERKPSCSVRSKSTVSRRRVRFRFTVVQFWCRIRRTSRSAGGQVGVSEVEQRQTWSRGQQKTTVEKKRLLVGKISLPIYIYILQIEHCR